MASIGAHVLDGIPHPTYVFGDDTSERSKLFHQPAPASHTGLLPYYLMDPASVFPVLALDVREHHRVLDVCAAPGGKSVVIAQYLGKMGFVCLLLVVFV